jgi:hypothetical protein
MKKVMIISLVSATLLMAQTSLDIAKKSFAQVSGYKSSISKVTMVLKDAKNHTNHRELIIKKLENANGDKSLIEFLYPKDIKDTKLLSYEKIGSDDKQWLYLPALKRVKRISSRNKSGSFVSSEFSYEDIASTNYKNYTYDKDFQTVTKNGKSYFKITRIPIDKYSGYSKQIVYINTKNYLLEYGEFYDRYKKLLKSIEFEYAKKSTTYRVTSIKIHNIKNKKSTSLFYKSDKINANLSENDFKKRVLK